MSGFSALDEEELYLLQDFASSIRPNFVVGEHVQQMINFLKELNTNRTEEKVEFDVVQHLETKDMINDALGSVDYSACDNLKNCSQTNKDDCKVSLIFGDLHMNNIILPKGNTWSSLKEIIETRYKEMEFNEIVVAMVMVVRTKYFRHNFDETCIDPAEILSGDTLLVDFDTIQQRAARNVERVYNSGLHVKNKFQFLALVVHSFMLDEGFVSIVELLESPHTLKRPWREIPPASLVREDWDCDVSTVRFTYRHKFDPEHTLCKTLVNDLSGSTVVSLSTTDEHLDCVFHIVDMCTDYYVAADATLPLDLRYTISHLEELHALVEELLNRVLPGLPRRSGEKAEFTPSLPTAAGVSDMTALPGAHPLFNSPASVAAGPVPSPQLSAGHPLPTPHSVKRIGRWLSETEKDKKDERGAAFSPSSTSAASATSAASHSAGTQSMDSILPATVPAAAYPSPSDLLGSGDGKAAASQGLKSADIPSNVAHAKGNSSCQEMEDEDEEVLTEVSLHSFDSFEKEDIAHPFGRDYVACNDFEDAEMWIMDDQGNPIAPMRELGVEGATGPAAEATDYYLPWSG